VLDTCVDNNIFFIDKTLDTTLCRVLGRTV
jgi:hypothetical protein